jgi:putative phosphoesterase
VSDEKDVDMRIAAIYDIHGNLPALDAVLEEIDRASVDRLVVGGDVVPGPMPRETLERLQSLDIPVRFIKGNGDRAVLKQMAGVESVSLPEQVREVIRWTARQLDLSHQRLLASWPDTLRADVDGVGEVLFCHATPHNDTDIFTRSTPEDRLRPMFEGLDVPLVVCGHTHMQFDRRIGRVRVVNAGSVGMPFGNPGAYWLLLEPDVQLRHTPYDYAKAAERVRNTTYPQAQDFAARNILQPPSEEQTLEGFAKAEIK